MKCVWSQDEEISMFGWKRKCVIEDNLKNLEPDGFHPTVIKYRGPKTKQFGTEESI